MYNCDECRHSGICKYEDDARKYEENLRSIEEHPDILNFRIVCKKYARKFMKEDGFTLKGGIDVDSRI